MKETAIVNTIEYCYYYYVGWKIDLIVKSTNPFVDNVEHGLLFNGGSKDERNDSQHGQSSIDNFGFLCQSGLEGRHVSEWLGITCRLLLVHGVVGVQQERVSEWKWADGGHEGNGEKVSVGHQDDGTFVGDGALSRNGGQSTPFRKVQESISIRDQAMALAVGCGADENPSEHGMTSVPLLGLNRWTPSVFGERSKLTLPVLLGGFVNLTRSKAQGTIQEIHKEIDVSEPLPSIT